jgi:hypothetical protein
MSIAVKVGKFTFSDFLTVLKNEKLRCAASRFFCFGHSEGIFSLCFGKAKR